MTKKEQSLKIGIFGSAVEPINSNTLKSTKELGKLLAQKKCEVITGMAIGISHKVLLEAKKYGAKTKGFSPDINSKKHKKRFDNAPLNDFDSVVFTKGFSKRSLKLIEYCDALIVIDGRMGTLSEYSMAFEEKKLIGVLTSSGGIAKHLNKITKLCNKHRSIPIFFNDNYLNLVENIFNYLKLNYIENHIQKRENPKRFYDLDNLSQQPKIMAEHLMRDIIKKEKFNSLLDIGSGDGHFLRDFIDKDICGIEISSKMIESSNDLKKYLIREDIADKSLTDRFNRKFDIISSNYVFTELKIKQLKIAFNNANILLKNKGTFIFTITNPKTRHLSFPFHKLIFSEPYSYNKRDLQFKVLLKNSEGNFEDVGIRDYHHPVEVYDALLKKAGFKKIKKINVRESKEKPIHALIYVCKK